MRKGQSVRLISTQVGSTAARALAVAFAFYASGAAASEIVVTVAGPSSGSHSDRTAQMLAGARRAAAGINANGGIKGATIAIESVDDGCAADQAKAAASALAARKSDLVIGHPCAAAASAAAKIYAGSQLLFIATGTRHGGFQRGAPATTTIFRLSGRESAQGAEGASYLAQRFPGGTIAVVHDRTRASKKLAEHALAELKKRGAPEPITATVIGGDKDFPVLTAKIKSAAAIFYAGYPLEAGMLYAQLRKAGSTAAFLMSDSGGTEEFTDTFGARAEGVRVMRPRFAIQSNRDNATTAPSVQTEIANADQKLAAAAVAAYAAAANLADAVNPASVARELSARPYETADGVVAFDKNGEARRPSYDVLTWTGSTWEEADIAARNP